MSGNYAAATPSAYAALPAREEEEEEQGEEEQEQAPLAGVSRRDAEPAEAAAQQQPAGGGESVGQQKTRRPCRKRCVWWLQTRKVRGLRLPAFLGLLGSLVLPEMDAVSDWLVTIDFYEGGDMGWFEASLTILVVSGGFATLGLIFVVFFLHDA